jgi:spore germination protein
MRGRIYLNIYVVKPGDTIHTISKAYGVNPNEIITANELDNPNDLVVGQTLVIPGRSQKLGTINVNGYAFPEINMGILNKTLPFLTFLSIFSYEVNSDGSLKTINDAPLIKAARDRKVAPIMVITNIKSPTGFSSELTHQILTNNAVQEKLINNIINTLRSKNYYGLNIDFEYIFPYDLNSYNNFVRKVTARLHSLGYIVNTSLAPKTSATQPGLLYEAHSYPFHGATVDHVVLMTYEWGYLAGPPLAVAPLNNVKKVINYAVTAIPPHKILMGIPNYGYDWKLPYAKGTNAVPLSTVQAVDRAKNVKAAIKYDPVAASPNYSYYDKSKSEHIVWFEDARSIHAKLMLVNEYHLGGVSYWTIERYFPQNWLILESMYNIRKVI